MLGLTCISVYVGEVASAEALDQFRTGDIKVCLLNLKTGARGL
jgi:hypothetical protein